MIETSGIFKRFGKVQALKDVTITCSAGECIALLGPNGCGKTTLIKSILGMVIPDSGIIRFGGADIRNQYQYREQLGYMPQIGRYPDNMTVGQVMETIRRLRKPEHPTDETLYEKFRLAAIQGKRMSALSGGTRQKVSAVLAFMFSPQVLILDEPTAGLDPLAAEILKEKIIEEKSRGRLILITSHLLSELDDIVTEIIFMQEGSVQFHKKTEALKTETGEATISKAITRILKEQSR